jgi:hypothetical protein
MITSLSLLERRSDVEAVLRNEKLQIIYSIYIFFYSFF